MTREDRESGIERHRRPRDVDASYRLDTTWRERVFGVWQKLSTMHRRAQPSQAWQEVTHGTYDMLVATRSVLVASSLPRGVEQTVGRTLCMANVSLPYTLSAGDPFRGSLVHLFGAASRTAVNADEVHLFVPNEMPIRRVRDIGTVGVIASFQNEATAVTYFEEGGIESEVGQLRALGQLAMELQRIAELRRDEIEGFGVMPD